MTTSTVFLLNIFQLTAIYYHNDIRLYISWHDSATSMCVRLRCTYKYVLQAPIPHIVIVIIISTAYTMYYIQNIWVPTILCILIAVYNVIFFLLFCLLHTECNIIIILSHDYRVGNNTLLCVVILLLLLLFVIVVVRTFNTIQYIINTISATNT